MGVEERIRDIIVEQLHPDEGRITRQARFDEDLGAHPEDVVRLLSRFEEVFKITISPDQAEKIATVGQAIEYVEAHTAHVQGS